MKVVHTCECTKNFMATTIRSKIDFSRPWNFYYTKGYIFSPLVLCTSTLSASIVRLSFFVTHGCSQLCDYVWETQRVTKKGKERKTPRHLGVEESKEGIFRSGFLDLVIFAKTLLFGVGSYSSKIAFSLFFAIWNKQMSKKGIGKCFSMGCRFE